MAESGTQAENADVKRIVYLGGLGEEADPKLSPHLRSRHEVGKILRDSGIEVIEFRASVVIGSGDVVTYGQRKPLGRLRAQRTKLR